MAIWGFCSMRGHVRNDIAALLLTLAVALAPGSSEAGTLERIKYNNPGLKVDLGVGLWAWPMVMDYDGDGLLDLVVSCPDKPYNGTYFFKNTGDDPRLPLFEREVRLGPGYSNIRASVTDGALRVLRPGNEFTDFTRAHFEKPVELGLPDNIHRAVGNIRANQWTFHDYDSDGAYDLIVGVDDWGDYGWDDAFDSEGNWTRGPLRGFVYLIPNTGSTEAPTWGEPRKIEADGTPIEVFGWPSPNFADFDGDGDADLICGEFLDRFTYFQNIGTEQEPRYAAGRLLEHDGAPLRMDLEMIVPTAVDWTKDGHVDLVVGDEDGRVALVEHRGEVVDGLPQFSPPEYFQQEADFVKYGAIITPVSVDWDGDGDEDVICGDTAGHIGFIENLSGGVQPQWAAPVNLKADGTEIRIQAGPNGSIQGPCEAKWGYTTPSVGDWDHDGLPDVVVNSIWGEIVWYRNIGTREAPELSAAQHVEVTWPGTPPKPAWTWWEPEGNQLVTQWRTTPIVIDWNEDGLNDLVMLDTEGYLAFYERTKNGEALALQPPRRIFVDREGKPLQLNEKRAGGSGRRKLHIVDWDGDGRRDLLANSLNADFWRNVETRADGTVVLENQGLMSESPLGGHSSSPTTVDWDANGIPDLLVGAEDGHLYYMRNPRADAE